jgi:hypothetical protein
MEVFRRWEEFRTNVLIRAEQKDSLKNLDQEHILLINEKGEFELHPYFQIEEVAGGNPAVRAFLFFRKGKTCVVYWHTSGKGQMEVKFNTGHMHLYEELDKEIPMETDGKRVILPLGNRKYLETRLSREEVISAFQRAVIIE